MKRFLNIMIAGLLAVATAGCWEKAVSTKITGPLYRAHFVGLDAIMKGTNGTTFKTVWKMPSSVNLREETLQKLARAPHEFWKAKLPAGTANEAALIRPLLDDLLQNESILEVRGPLEKPETTLAIRLSPERATLWDNKLTQLMAAWNLGKPANLSNAKGWEIVDGKAAGHIQFLRSGEWVLLGFGAPKLELLGAWSIAAEKGRPVPSLTNRFLQIDADLPHLRTWFPLLAEYPLPPVQMSTSGSGPDLKTDLLLKYSGKVPFKFEPWKIPRDVISDPLVSFTVAQGLAPLLKDFKSVEALRLNSIPNQFCMWGLAHKFPVTYVSVPVPNATNAVNQLALSAPKVLESKLPGHMGEILWNSNRAVVFWKDVPFVAPSIRPLVGRNGEYIFGELFPQPPFTNPPPAALFAQFSGRTDLLYYDWEMTPERMPHDNQFFQLHDIADYRRVPPQNSVSQQWISSVATNLAECTTEITLASPTELKLIRRSQLGFSGFELVGLARWMQSTRFPFAYEQPPQIRMSTNAVANPPKSNPPKSGQLQKPPSTTPAPTKKQP